MRIEINNLTTSEIDKDFLKELAKKILKEENKKEAELNIILVGQGRIKKLNKKYRGKNKITDVLSFPSRENKKEFIVPLEEKKKLGEVVICLRRVRKNAKRYNSDFRKELTRVLIHGILHLLGYEHEKSEIEAKKMKKKEEYYLSQI